MEGTHMNGSNGSNAQSEGAMGNLVATRTAGANNASVFAVETTETEANNHSTITTPTTSSPTGGNNNSNTGLTQLIAQVPQSIRNLSSAGPVDLTRAFLREQEAVGVQESRLRVAVSIPLHPLTPTNTATNSYRNYHEQAQQQQLDALFSPVALAALATTTPAQDNQTANTNDANLAYLNPASLHDQLAILLLRKKLREARQIQQSDTSTDMAGHSSSTVATATQVLNQMQRLQDRVDLQKQLQQQLQQQHRAAFPPPLHGDDESCSSPMHNVLPPKVASVVMGIMNDRNSRRRPQQRTSIWAALQQPVPPGLGLDMEVLQEETSTSRRLAHQAGLKRETSQEDIRVPPHAVGVAHVTPTPSSASSDGSNDGSASDSSSSYSSTASSSSFSSTSMMLSSLEHVPADAALGATAGCRNSAANKRQRVSETLEE